MFGLKSSKTLADEKARADRAEEELARYRDLFGELQRVCDQGAKGDLQARVVHTQKFGSLAALPLALNRLLDLTDAFVRESGASLHYASQGKFFRAFLTEGILGDFRRGAEVINTARLGMETRTLEAAAAEEQRRGMEKLEQERVLAEARSREERANRIAAMIAAFEGEAQTATQSLATAATQLRGTATIMASTAERGSNQAMSVAAAAEQATANVQTVAAATEELSASVREISGQVHRSSSVAGEAVSVARQTDKMVNDLSEGAKRIGDVVKLIADIASQTNLLALNATIEAARAGEAGKGFAVVASEVKALANQTAKATEEIGHQVGAIQEATQASVVQIQNIVRTIGEISTISTTIASAVEEQGSATNEIARNVQEAASGTQSVAASIGEVSTAAAETGTSANELLGAAGELEKVSGNLRTQIDRFIGEVRAA